MELLCDSHHGVFIPQLMARRLHDAGWECVELEKVVELEFGPDENEWYWDVWNDILNSAVFTDENGVKWYLHHDGDLFAVTESDVDQLDNF